MWQGSYTHPFLIFLCLLPILFTCHSYFLLQISCSVFSHIFYRYQRLSCQTNIGTHPFFLCPCAILFTNHSYFSLQASCSILSHILHHHDLLRRKGHAQTLFSSFSASLILFTCHSHSPLQTESTFHFLCYTSPLRITRWQVPVFGK